MEQAIQSVLLNEHQLAVRVQELGRQISADYEGKNLLLVCILKGSVVFTADLMRALRIPCTLDFMRVSQLWKRRQNKRSRPGAQGLGAGHLRIRCIAGRGHSRQRTHTELFKELARGASPEIHPHLYAA